MEEVNRRRRTVLQVQVGELHLWCLNQSSSPRKCTSHLGLSLDVTNEDPKPFVWTKTADQILANVAHFCQRTLNTGH